MKSTVIKKGATASIILGFGALFSAYGSSAVDPNNGILSSNHSINLTKKITADRFINSNNMYSFNFGLSSVLSTLSKVKSGLSEVKGTLSEVKGTLSEVKSDLSEVKGHSSSVIHRYSPNKNGFTPGTSINNKSTFMARSDINVSFSTNIYEDPGTFNVPIIKVYIDGQPVNLILDTGDTGVVVYKSAVNIPSSDYISSSTYNDYYHKVDHEDYLFSVISSAYGRNHPRDTFSEGLLASATVCLNPNIAGSCVVMPIGVLTSGTLFPGEPNEGIFGLAEVPPGLVATAFSSTMAVYSYPYYLEQQTGIDSYRISFISLSNNYYANIPPTQPIGQISFNHYNGNSNTLIPYKPHNVHMMYCGGGNFPFETFGSHVMFGPYLSESDVIFDTASPANLLNGADLKADLFNIIPHEGACARYNWPDSFANNYINKYVVDSSYTISYTIKSYTGSFVTEPPVSFCSNPPAFNLLNGITVDRTDVGSSFRNIRFIYQHDIFGLPAMLGHTFTFVLGAPGSSSQGIVQYLGISK